MKMEIVLILSFQFICLLLYFFAQLPWLALPVQCWIETAREKTFFQFLLIQYEINCRFFLDALDKAKFFFSYWLFLSSKDVAFCQILFKNDHMSFFVLYFINMLYYIDFSYVKSTLHSWGKSYMVIVYNPVLLESVYLYLIEDLCICIPKRYWSIVFLWYLYLFLYQSNELGSVPPSDICLQEF